MDASVRTVRHTPRSRGVAPQTPGSAQISLAVDQRPPAPIAPLHQARWPLPKPLMAPPVGWTASPSPQWSWRSAKILHRRGWTRRVGQHPPLRRGHSPTTPMCGPDRQTLCTVRAEISPPESCRGRSSTVRDTPEMDPPTDPIDHRRKRTSIRARAGPLEGYSRTPQPDRSRCNQGSASRMPLGSKDRGSTTPTRQA